MTDIRFESIENKEPISTLRTNWLDSLTFPNDSFDESTIDGSQHWALKLKEEIIGYASVFKKESLLQFYITPEYLNHGTDALGAFIKQNEIKKAFAGTNNPSFLSLIMHFQKSIEIDTYLFKDDVEIQQEERDAEFRLAEINELERLLDFNTKAYPEFEPSEASKESTRKYYADCLNKEVIYALEKNDEIIGILEVRTSTTSPKKTTFGVVVLPDYRKQGYASYLIVKGKSIAKTRDSQAVIGCRATNIGSRKAIEKSGFRILHLILLINL